jgi:NADH-quinone oxidoreductase subunit G
MPKFVIDGREAEFKPGENLIEVAKRVGVEIPFFCYHEGMSVVAQCRMCLVEIEKMPKLQTACSTPPADGMVVKTKSDRVKAAQKATMEFLLINHPLDCPICDKSGECDLQDNSFKFGDSYSRYTEERRAYLDLDMGPVIKKNMNRCIHCTRCIRFGTEVAGIHEMVAVQRGNNTEITTIDGRPLETDYAGNYADVCPTGSLTLKDFRFNKRVWMLKKTPTICEGCSRGCNMELHQDANVIHRSMPRKNMEVNKHWLCDEGRFNYHHVHDPKRVTDPAVQEGGSLNPTDWPAALEAARKALAGKKPTVLLGTDLTQEEAELARGFVAKNFAGTTVCHFGTPGVKKASDDADADKILKRKSKTANLHGLEKLGIAPFEGAMGDAALVITSGRAVLPELKSATIVGVGVFRKPQAEKFAAVLPGLTFAEKEGTIVNFEGREQKFKRALQPIGKSKGLSEILSAWVNG